MSKNNTYIGGHTVISDPARYGRLQRNLRKTRQAQKRKADARERLQARLAAFNESARSVLIKAKPADNNDVASPERKKEIVKSRE